MRSKHLSDREPDLSIGAHFALWVFSRQYPDSQDFWDGNWLNVFAQVQTPGVTVEAQGSFLRNTEIERFRVGLEEMQQKVSGEARLDCLEPNLKINLRCDALGHITAGVAITPEHLTQSHSFEFAIDQTFLPRLIAGCKNVLAQYPVRGLKAE